MGAVTSCKVWYWVTLVVVVSLPLAAQASEADDGS